VRDESYLTPRAITPSKRGNKEDRITYGLGLEMENSKVYININCRNQMQLRTEIEGFPAADDDHGIDALDQCIYYLKRAKTRLKAGWL
jgi:phage terminase large subunit-like protein